METPPLYRATNPKPLLAGARRLVCMSDSTSQLRQFHPDASDDAIAFHDHILDKMLDAQAPTAMITDFGHYVTPEAPAWTPLLVCDHPVALEIYGKYEVDGGLRCTQCVSLHNLWIPYARTDLLRDADALQDLEFALGELLDHLRKVERLQPNKRFKDIIANHESMIDDLSDLRTESNAYWNPPLEIEDGVRCGF